MLDVDVSMGIKPCPICNKIKDLIITSEDNYISAYNKGEAKGACICLSCWRCGLELYEHTNFGIDQYEIKKAVLINKWNSIARHQEDMNDGK